MSIKIFLAKNSPSEPQQLCWGLFYFVVELSKRLKAIIIDLEGQRFGRLLVLKRTELRSGTSIKWKCICDCGKIINISSSHLVNNKTRSCGCLQKELVSQRATTHGLSYTSGYRAEKTRARQVAKIQRQPVWADKEAIEKFYRKCPKDKAVDHKYPLLGRLVSGLHVHNNLQYLSKSENSSKNNKFIPYIKYRNGKVKYLEEEFWHKESS